MHIYIFYTTNQRVASNLKATKNCLTLNFVYNKSKKIIFFLTTFLKQKKIPTAQVKATLGLEPINHPTN